MFVRAALVLLFCVTAVGAIAHQPAHHPEPPEPTPPVVVAPDARIPVAIQRVNVSTDILGGQAFTRIELEVLNPNDRVLEGELQFPLRPGQAVTGFALDIDGSLRPAVAVEKAKGRKVFEDITRVRVDPALLESAGGNRHKLRIYPLPANGTRRVVLNVAERLDATDGGLAWQLPLAFAQPVAELDVVVRLAGVAPPDVIASLGARRLEPVRGGKGLTKLTLSERDHGGDDSLRITLPAVPPVVLASAGFRGEQYFYAEPALPTLAAGPRPRPARVAIIWDASGSAAGRDLGSELAMLDAWFASVATEKPVTVLAQVVRERAQPVRRFEVRSGDWDGLRRFLRDQPFDGATSLAAMTVPEDVDVALVFTDGLGNFGGASLPPSATPRYFINSSVQHNAALMRAASRPGGARYLDLTSVPTHAAVEALGLVHPYVEDVRARGAERVVVGEPVPGSRVLPLAGILNSPEASLTLVWRTGTGERIEQALDVSAVPWPTHDGLPLPALRWAQLQLDALAVSPAANQGAVRRLGMAFGLATRETSLIVLDTLADYVTHEIEPPADMLAQWRRKLAEKQNRTEHHQEKHIDTLAARFEERVKWWNTSFPTPEQNGKPGTGEELDELTTAAVTAARERRSERSDRPLLRMSAPAAPPPAAARAEPRAGPDAPVSVASISLRPWEPDASYVHRLRNASDDELYAAYLDERPSWANSTAFFIDVADILERRGKPALALRVLSNLAEMDLEDRHILRILAYRLASMGEVELALPVLEEVLRLAPDEPQSWRDLGLALAEHGDYPGALEKLWHAARHPWDGRFRDIGLTALVELNAMVGDARERGIELDLDAIDPRLLRNLPLDLRVVLAWDADNTDIDLWVIDPDGEKAYYGNSLTRQGGRMSRDFVGGYGPETFELRTAKPGLYTVKAQFYGHTRQIVAPATTLMLRLTTGFGRKGGQEQRTVLRLGDRKDEVTVGQFEVK